MQRCNEEQLKTCMASLKANNNEDIRINSIATHLFSHIMTPLDLINDQA